MNPNVGLQASHDVVYVNRLDSLSRAHRQMQKIRTRHLPVVDELGQVIGMLSDRDLMRAMKKPVSSEWIAVPANPEFNPDESVQEYMSWPIGTVDEAAPLSQAAQLMLDRKMSALLVTKKGLAIGIITTEDLLKALIDDHKATDQKISLDDVKNQIFGVIYRSPVGSIIQSLSDAGI